MSSLGIIPIRYRSSRLPNKTFREVGGKPLIDWTLEAARESNLNAVVIVSSCGVVKDYCVQRGFVCVKRSEGLESDNCHVLHTINWLNDMHGLERGYDIQMLLQITNPTRTSKDIDNCLTVLENVETANSICSVVEVGEHHPSRMYKQLMGSTLEPLCKNDQWTNTQDLESLYLRDGSIYAWKTKAFIDFNGRTLLPQRILGYEIPKQRSVRIDTINDLRLADKMLTQPENLLT